MRLLLDTDTCVDIARGRLRVPDNYAATFIGVSTITVAELHFGVAKARRASAGGGSLNDFLAPFAILDFDASAAEAYGKLRADLQTRGTPIGALDMLIAAHALSVGATIVTSNVREFARVDGLTVESWR